MIFYKMQGAGNDYLYIDAISQSLPKGFVEQIPRLCHPHYGIGADGVILLTEGTGADIGMKMWNKDGSLGKMCGNGIRCLARLSHDLGYTEGEMTISTDGGVRHIALYKNKEGLVTGAEVEMGRPDFTPKAVPHLGDAPHLRLPFAGMERAFTALSMGNPHMTTFVDNLEQIPEKDGNALTKNPLFPDGVNVGVGMVTGKDALALRVFERGSGETLACGTGACAAVAVGTQKGYFVRGKPVTVRMAGGTLTVTQHYDASISLYGDCQYICKGEWYEF